MYLGLLDIAADTARVSSDKNTKIDILITTRCRFSIGGWVFNYLHGG